MPKPRTSTNPKTIASRDRQEGWSEDAKALYKARNADSKAASIRISKLRNTELWLTSSENEQLRLEEDLKDRVMDERREVGNHDNALK